jgi:hypothetical protein
MHSETMPTTDPTLSKELTEIEVMVQREEATPKLAADLRAEARNRFAARNVARAALNVADAKSL